MEWQKSAHMQHSIFFSISDVQDNMYSKTQIKLLIGYIVIVIVSILVRHNGFDRHTSTPLDLILGAPIPFAIGVFAIQNGRISSRFSTVDRDEAPATFWFYVAFALLLGAGMFLWGIRDALHSSR
ncbi:MAG: hypothetical protein ACXWIN_02675 [Burkholderiaceae bacterium]